MTTTHPTDCGICGFEINCGHTAVSHNDGEAHKDCKVRQRAIDQGRIKFCAKKAKT